MFHIYPQLVCTNQNQYTRYDNKPNKSPGILDYTFCDPKLHTHLKNWTSHNNQSTDWIPDYCYLTYELDLQWIHSDSVIPPHWNWHRADSHA